MLTQTVGQSTLTQPDRRPTLPNSQGLNIQLLIVKIEKEIAPRKTERVALETLFILQLDKKPNYLAAFTPKTQQTEWFILKSGQN